MNKKLIVLILGFILINAVVILKILNKSSAAYEYTKSNYTLFYKDDMQELANDISKYISEIDDYIFPNSSFKYSNVLTQNYDFVTNFAISYILDNKELYLDKITSINKGEYINIEEIYQITDKYFGLRDYEITKKQFTLVNDNILLVAYNTASFKEIISNTMAYKRYDQIIVDITYDSGNSYRYTFNNYDNVLKLYDVEVLS